LRNVFSATDMELAVCLPQGDLGNREITRATQCRRNVIIVGFLSELGSESFDDEGALLQISGTGDVLTDLGNAQLLSSCWNVISKAIRTNQVVKLISGNEMRRRQKGDVETTRRIQRIVNDDE